MHPYRRTTGPLIVGKAAKLVAFEVELLNVFHGLFLSKLVAFAQIGFSRQTMNKNCR